MPTWCSLSSPMLIKLRMHTGFALVQHLTDVNLLWSSKLVALSDMHCVKKTARRAQSCNV